MIKALQAVVGMGITGTRERLGYLVTAAGYFSQGGSAQVRWRVCCSYNDATAAATPVLRKLYTGRTYTFLAARAAAADN